MCISQQETRDLDFSGIASVGLHIEASGPKILELAYFYSGLALDTLQRSMFITPNDEHPRRK